MITVLSLGAGVQSSALALLAAHGELPPVDYAIFADTMAEPAAVYKHLEFLRRELPFPVITVSAGNLWRDSLAGTNSTGHKFSPVPWHMASGGLGRRQCTKEYKLAPIYRHIRQQGATSRKPVTLFTGISADEAHRAKPARVKYVANYAPLIDAGLSRGKCLEWLGDRGYPEPPKSSCVFCPYRDNKGWRALSDAEFGAAVAVDYAIRARGVEQYAHRDRKPLDRANLTTAASAGQVDAFGEECEGMCGV